MYKTPLLILGFNRPSHIERIINLLRDLSPFNLFFSFDGPRNDIDKKLIENSISQLAKIDWPCEIRINKLTTNHGGCYGPVNGISWFFKNVSFGIVFDDDLIPRPEFFDYIENARYFFENDSKIAAISGNNFSNPLLNFWEGKVGISEYFFGWGWATWANKWNSFNVDWDSIKELVANNTLLLNILHGDQLQVDKQIQIYETWKNGAAWDYLWQFHLWKNGWKTIIPPVNLVGNLGIGDDSTNYKIEFPFITSWKKNWQLELPKDCFSSFKISPLGDRFNGYVTHFGISSEKLAIIKSEDGVDLFALIN